MNFSVLEPVLGRQRCRHWTPLLTQQLRLRHLYQIMAYNVTTQGSGSFYYTLHLTTMCAPFYTSEKKDSVNPKWAELDTRNLPYPSSSVFVLRIWQTTDSDMDVIVTTWGVHLSGLVYLGMKLSEIQPEYFNDNSVILYLRGGFFTSHDAFRKDLQKPLQFIDNSNIMSTEFETKVYRNTVLMSAKNEVKDSYTVSKLQKLHSLQLTIKNKSLDVQIVADKITRKCGLCDPGTSDPTDKSTTSDDGSPIYRHPSQLLTMNTLNKMLQGRTTKIQRQQIARVKKQIEIAKFRTKLLTQERDKKSAHIRHLKQTFTTLMDDNEERGCLLMENYRKLSRDSDKLKEWRREHVQLKEMLQQINMQLHHRRRQLVSQLLSIYPITKAPPNKHLVNGIYLPDSENLSDCSDDELAVALGYVSHVLLMCSSFLQVPLRYPITFFGSRSHISDHITAALAERDRDFPLYAKGKDRMQFNYAVYLLNKDIAQLRWICGQHTPDLRATLPNLHSLLQGRDNKENPSSRPSSAHSRLPRKISQQSDSSYSTEHANYPQKSLDFISHFDRTSNVCDPIFDALRQECQAERSLSPTRRNKKRGTKTNEPRPGLGQILAVPEAFMNKQISHTDFKNYIETERFRCLNLDDDEHHESGSTKISIASQSISGTKKDYNSKINNHHVTPYKKDNSPSCDSDIIEQGTDILHSSLNLVDCESDNNITPFTIEEHPKTVRSSTVDGPDRLLKQNRRISRSVGSITEEENPVELHNSLELGSDPLLNLSAEALKNFSSKNLNLESISTEVEDGQQEFLQKWLDSGPALVCSEENLYPDEILGTTVSIAGSTGTNNNSSPLTLRTDALLNTTSFNLIKPK